MATVDRRVLAVVLVTVVVASVGFLAWLMLSCSLCTEKCRRVDGAELREKGCTETVLSLDRGNDKDLLLVAREFHDVKWLILDEPDVTLLGLEHAMRVGRRMTLHLGHPPDAVLFALPEIDLGQCSLRVEIDPARIPVTLLPPRLRTNRDKSIVVSVPLGTDDASAARRGRLVRWLRDCDFDVQ